VKHLRLNHPGAQAELHDENLIQAGPNLSAGVKILKLNPIRCECMAADSFLVGTWLSLVEHSLGVRGVGSSNLPVPTNYSSFKLS
jgi:hypothetical protein